MDRTVVQVGELPRAEDFLGAQVDALIGVAGLSQATIGGLSTGVAGLAISATSPASLSVIIGTGSIYVFDEVDATAYGVLGTNSNVIYKQGLLETPVTLTCTAPSTSGYSQNYLVQAGYADVDGGSTVLPYFNSANPNIPWNGPGGSGQAQNTIRQGQLIIQLLPGVAAPSGSQVTPSATAGFVALYAITVANSATQLTSSNWTMLSTNGSPYGAPWFPNLQSLFSLFLPLLSTATTFYVSTTGNDTTGNGTALAPWATLQHAINFLSGYASISPITIKLSAGTFTLTAPGPTGIYAHGLIQNTTISQWNIVGAGAGSTILNCNNIAQSYGIIAQEGSTVFVSGLTVSGVTNTAFSSFSGSLLSVFNVNASAGTGGASSVFNSVNNALLYVYNYLLLGTYSYTISGTWNAIFIANPGRMFVGYLSQTSEFTFSSCTVNSAVSACFNGSLTATVGYVTFTGAVAGAGARSSTAANGVTNCSGGGTSFFPAPSGGTGANTTSSGGQYLP